MKEEKRSFSLFNSPLEIGVRIVALLTAYNFKQLSFQEILYLDYLVIHLRDLDTKSKSLHPDIPNRAGEIIVKRRVFQESIDLMLSRELINKFFLETGVKYSASNLSKPFMDTLNNPYIGKVKSNAKTIFDRFRDTSEDDLEKFVTNNIKNWGSEFDNESYLYDYLDI